MAHLDKQNDKKTNVTKTWSKNKRVTEKDVKEENKQIESIKNVIILSIAFFPDSLNIAVGYNDAIIRVWVIEELSNFFCLKGHLEAVLSLMYTRDNQYIISAGNKGELLIWSVKDQSSLISLFAHKNDIFSL